MKFSTDALWFSLLHLEFPLLLYNLVEVTHPSGRILRKKMSTKRKMIIAYKSYHYWASLVAQWLRVCLPVQGTWVRVLVWEDPTCRGATRPVSHSC